MSQSLERLEQQREALLKEIDSQANQLNSSFVGVWQPVKAEVKLFKGIDVSFENAPYTLDLKEDGTAMVTKEKASQVHGQRATAWSMSSQAKQMMFLKSKATI